MPGGPAPALPSWDADRRARVTAAVANFPITLARMPAAAVEAIVVVDIEAWNAPMTRPRTSSVVVVMMIVCAA